MKVTTAKQLANYLQDIRHNQGLSQSKIGEKIGLRQGTVSNFEQNPESTKLDTLFKLLSALELEIELKPRNPAQNVNTSSWDQEW
ncbi:helix-turn-helix domain-containing protein [Vibrio sp. PP-XX7]